MDTPVPTPVPTIDTPVPSPAPTTAVITPVEPVGDGFFSIGCRADEADDRIMGDVEDASSEMTTEVCLLSTFGISTACSSPRGLLCDFS